MCQRAGRKNPAFCLEISNVFITFTENKLIDMIRQQRRRETRETAKALKKVEKMKEFKEMNTYFDRLLKEDLELLEAKTHTDPKQQKLYDRHIANMKYYIALQSKLEMLTMKKQDV